MLVMVHVIPKNERTNRDCYCDKESVGATPRKVIALEPL